MILDYSNYITSKGVRGIVNSKNIDSNIGIFNHNPVCPFCKKNIDTTIYHKYKTDYPDWLFGSFDQSETVIQCPDCGWWEYEYYNTSDAIIDGIRATEIEYHSAVLRIYKDNDNEVPIGALREYILRKPDIIYKIDAHKMEELVRSVFSDYYPSCKVKYVGKTRDGGKDAILIDDNGKQTFIQIKRRTQQNATEGVGALRELIGASVIENDVRGCIFVTTADHFSKDSVDYSNKCISKKIVEQFDLINCSEFLRITNLMSNQLPKIWNNLIRL